MHVTNHSLQCILESQNTQKQIAYRTAIYIKRIV